MGRVADELGYRVLRTLFPAPDDVEGHYEDAAQKLTTHFGDELWRATEGKTVVDFGCGLGSEAVELCRRGARRVVGIDVREELLEHGRALARDQGWADRCEFTTSSDAAADLVLSLDSFEHFGDPAAALAAMARLLGPGGEIWISFGWPWYHPYGGHLFSVFPWAHLVFSESALLRWRSEFKTDGAQRFAEVDGGLNQMSVQRFEGLVAASGLRVTELRTTPIRALRWLHGRRTREFTSALVQCRLRRA